MKVGEFCIRKVVSCSLSDTIADAAGLMRQGRVGDVVVVDESTGEPVGMVTDRDIVVGAVAVGLDPSTLLVRDLVLGDLVTIQEDEGVFEAIQQMRKEGVRRLPVIDVEGQLVGIIAIDDLLEIIADDLSSLVQVMRGQRRHEADHWSVV